MSVTKSRDKVVVVIGGGFGGLQVAKGLRNAKGVQVILIDRRNHHLFQPLLYQVAMAGLSPAEIATPIRTVFSRAPNVRVVMAEVQQILPTENRIITDRGDYAYDELVLACGAEHSYFGHEEWEAFAPGLKTVEQATEIRRRVLTAFERAETEMDQSADKIRPWLTFVIVGGGPTGVELAGALGEITRFTLNRDFRHIDPSRTRVILIEAGTRLLTAFHEDLSRRAMRDLEQLGVQVWTGCRVTEVNNEGVRVGAEWIDAKTVIWAAGVKPSPLNLQLPGTLDRVGRIHVTSRLHLEQKTNIYVIGDQATLQDSSGTPLPGVAPVAMQQGRWLARHLINKPKGTTPSGDVFTYQDKGQMATIGRRKAVVQTGRLHVTGLIAWYLWLLIHIFYLIGFKNRLFVIWEWGFSYLTYKRGARLITNPDWRDTVPPQRGAPALTQD